MKRIVSCLFALLLAVSAGVSVAGEADEAAVKKVVVEAYLEGVHITGDPGAMRQGFHPDFEMLMLRDGELGRMPISEWITMVEQARKKGRYDENPDVSYEFPLVSVAGDAAVVRVEVHKDGAHVFTDFLSLYRFEDGWKIVGKIYHRY